MKAIIHASHRRFVFHEVCRGAAQCCISKRFRVPIELWMEVSATSSGREPASV